MKLTFYTKHIVALLCLFLLCCLSLQAQEEIRYDYSIYATNNHQVGDTLTVLADTAYIRNKPATTGQKVGQLTAGARVVFLKDDDDQKISGFIAPWTYVRFLNNGAPMEGYIWKGLLALGSLQRGGQQFLYGLDHVLLSKDQLPALFAKVKVLDAGNTLLTAKTWPLSSSEATNFSEGKLLGNMGLDSLTGIVRICFSGEACGIPTDHYYFGWTGRELLSLPGKTQLSDAGVFYHTETLLFPSEQGGQVGKIIKLIEDEEATEQTDKKGEPIYKTTHSRESYSWDGRKAVKL